MLKKRTHTQLHACGKSNTPKVKVEVKVESYESDLYADCVTQTNQEEQAYGSGTPEWVPVHVSKRFPKTTRS